MVLRTLCNAIAVASFLAITLAATTRAAAVDTELVLAVDISGSISPAEAEQQRQGYVAALTDPVFLQAIRQHQIGKLAISYIEWAGADQQWIAVPWTVIESEATARAFAARIPRPRQVNQRGTSISAAIDFATSAILNNTLHGRRLVIDISGDGPNNVGRPVLAARAEAEAQGIIINGLPIINTDDDYFGGLDRYYSDCVVAGPGAFLLPAPTMAEFASAIRRKLILEVIGAAAPNLRQPGISPAAQTDCLIGEKLRERYLGKYYPQL